MHGRDEKNYKLAAEEPVGRHTSIREYNIKMNPKEIW
jgi:hypothetical protein